jgi:uncharacterized coiled-coil DUF342 family protein
MKAEIDTLTEERDELRKKADFYKVELTKAQDAQKEVKTFKPPYATFGEPEPALKPAQQYTDE